jgi:hypothetical protein
MTLLSPRIHRTAKGPRHAGPRASGYDIPFKSVFIEEEAELVAWVASASTARRVRVRVIADIANFGDRQDEQWHPEKNWSYAFATRSPDAFGSRHRLHLMVPTPSLIRLDHGAVTDWIESAFALEARMQMETPGFELWLNCPMSSYLSSRVFFQWLIR